MPRRAAYRWMASAWFSVEYFWCSVDMRTYWAARIGRDPPDAPPSLARGSDTAAPRSVWRGPGLDRRNAAFQTYCWRNASGFSNKIDEKAEWRRSGSICG